MFQTFLFIMILAIGVPSCGQKEAGTNVFPDGTYTGSFRRTAAMGPSSRVQITFLQGRFSGESSSADYPVICGGTYTVHKETILFTDTCNHPEGADKNLLLNGEFSFSFHENSLEFRKESPGGGLHLYQLKKQ